MRSCLAVVSLALMILGAPAWTWAQPSTPPTPAPAPGAAPAEDPGVQAEYDKAFSALVAVDYDAAIAGMNRVAQSARLATTRATASELARLGGELKAKTSAGGPATKTSVVTERERQEDLTAGRTTFISTTTIASLYAGVVLIDLLDQGDDFRASVGIITGATALGFLGSFYGSRDKTITQGMADTYSLGLGLGLGNALLLASPLGMDTSEKFQSFALGGVVAGGVASMLLADNLRPSRAQASVVGTTSTLGIATVGLGLGIVQPNNIDADTVLTLVAVGLDAGAGVGIYLSKGMTWSLSRARRVSLGTFLGALGGWAIGALSTGASFDSSGNRDTRIWATSTLLGIWGGFALTAHLTRNMAPDKSHMVAHEPQRMVLPTMIAGRAPGFAVAGSF